MILKSAEIAKTAILSPLCLPRSSKAVFSEPMRRASSSSLGEKRSKWKLLSAGFVHRIVALFAKRYQTRVRNPSKWFVASKGAHLSLHRFLHKVDLRNAPMWRNGRRNGLKIASSLIPRPRFSLQKATVLRMKSRLLADFSPIRDSGVENAPF